jgi:ubiquinone/menaquinone biosynthesis C-methylase UbiE
MTYQHVKADDLSIIKLYGQDRIATLSCGYLLPHITPTAIILDVGCGPGAITADFARLAPQGHTTGVDNSASIIAQAQTTFPSSLPGLGNLSFAVADATKLEAFPDNSFDIVHAHALLTHLPDPVAALKEFRRVVKPGGLVALREQDSTAIVSLKPDLPALRAYWDRSLKAMKRMRSNPMAGKELATWAREAGFGGDGEMIVESQSQMRNPSHLPVLKGDLGEQAVKYGMATREELEASMKAWEQWESDEGSEFVFGAGEVLCWKGT